MSFFVFTVHEVLALGVDNTLGQKGPEFAAPADVGEVEELAKVFL